MLSNKPANVLHPAFSSKPVMLTSDGAGAVKIDGTMMGVDISMTEKL